jgi:hypothetical protein
VAAGAPCAGAVDCPDVQLAGTGYVDCTGTGTSFAADLITAGLPPSPDVFMFRDHDVSGGGSDSFPNAGPVCHPDLSGVGGVIDPDTGICVPDGMADPNCLAPNSADPFHDPGLHPSACYSSVMGPLDGISGLGQGDAVVLFNMSVDVRPAGAGCQGPPSAPPILTPFTTGTAISGVMDAFGIPGRTQADIATGSQFMCNQILAGNAAGGVLVSTSPRLDLDLLGDPNEISATPPLDVNLTTIFAYE